MLDAHRSGIGGLAKLGEGVRANSDAKTQAGLTRGPNLSKKLINAAWTDTFPAQGATLDLDFANDRGFVRGIGQGRSMDAVTFTRASNGNYVKPDGTLSSHANQGALGNNLLTFPQDFDNAAWTKIRSTVSANATTSPDGTNTADAFIENSELGLHILRQAYTTITGTTYTLSGYFKPNGRTWMLLFANIPNTGAWFDIQNGTVGTVQSAVTSTSISLASNGYYRCAITFAETSGASRLMEFRLADADNSSSYTGDGESGIFIWGAQLELGSSATEYFPTNIGQPRFDWASTASTGLGTSASPYVIPLLANPTSNGLLIEEARTNRILWCRDATDAAWVKTNVTAAKDQTGIDGVANAASSLTATANDGTCIQTITLASGSRTGSVYLKRITGTGNIQVTLDGTTYSTVDLSASEWRRIVLSGTVTNPTVGIKLAVSGDAVAMDYGQVEDIPTLTCEIVSSPIYTTSATATRAADIATISGNTFNSFINRGKGTLYGETIFYNEKSTIAYYLSIGSLGSITLRRGINAGNNIQQFSYLTSLGIIATTYQMLSGAVNKAALGYQLGNITGYAQGTSFVNLPRNFELTNVNSMEIGNAGVSGAMIGSIKRVVYFPARLCDETLKAITTS